MVYLLHFDKPLKHAKHYLGYTSNLEERLARHSKGRGARLISVLKEQGISYQLVRTWEGDRKLERQLKNRKNSPELCPICNPKKEPEIGI